MYTRETACPYPIYTDPSRRLYDILGMARTLSLGHRDPEYIRHSLLSGMMKSVVQGVKRLSEGDAFRGGDMRQIGGEFLYETGGYGNRNNDNINDNPEVRVTWCHRMKNTRDHAEIPVLLRMLGLGEGATQAGNNDNTNDNSDDDLGGNNNNNKKLHRPLRRWTISSLTQTSSSNTSSHKRRWSRPHGLRLRGKSLDSGRARFSFGRMSSGVDYCGGDC